MRRGQVFGLLILFFGCQSPKKPAEHAGSHAGEWLPNAYASHFAIQVHENDTVIYLLNPTHSADTLMQYNLGTTQPRIASISTTHVPMFQALGALDQLAGVGYADYITDAEVRQRLDDGRLRAITSSDQLNFEVVIDIQPDVLLTYPYGRDNYDRYRKTGIAVLPISEYAESHPLGRAEWIKVIGLLTGNYTQSVSRFDQVVSAYQRVQELAAAWDEKPVVFTGSFFKGRWSAPGGESFVAQFIEDAGGRYAFSEYPGNENVELDFEVVLEKIAGADYFGKVLHREGGVTRDDFMEENRRFELLNDFSDDQLFYCNTFASDYFGRGLLEPHLMLRDVYQIIHRQKSGSEPFHYFKPLGGER